MLASSLMKLRRCMQPSALVMIFAGCGLSVIAQTPQPPYALLQYSTLTGSGNTITATQLPVVTATGITVYVNVTLQFNVDANGNLTVSNGYPQVIPAPPAVSSGFKAGTYVGPSTALAGKMIVNVSGPGLTDGGATEWTLSTAAGADGCTTPVHASWYVGPNGSSPWASRLQAAGITSTAWSYGITTGPGCNFTGVNLNFWSSALIGVSQVGNTITIASFTQNGVDKSEPQAQIVYTLKQ